MVIIKVLARRDGRRVTRDSEFANSAMSVAETIRHGQSATFGHIFESQYGYLRLGLAA